MTTKKSDPVIYPPYWACEYPACACDCGHIAGQCEYCLWMGAIYCRCPDRICPIHGKSAEPAAVAPPKYSVTGFSVNEVMNAAVAGASAEHYVDNLGLETTRTSGGVEPPLTPNNSETVARWIWVNFVGIPITEPYDKEYVQLFERIEKLQREWFVKGLTEARKQMSAAAGKQESPLPREAEFAICQGWCGEEYSIDVAKDYESPDPKRFCSKRCAEARGVESPSASPEPK